MKRLPENWLTAWTAAGTLLTAITMAVTAIVYLVRTAEGVQHCGERLDKLEPQTQKIAEDVAFLRGWFKPIGPNPEQQATSEEHRQ